MKTGDSTEFGVWFTSYPTAVISSYLTDDLTPVPMREHSDFTHPRDWLSIADKIDYCIVTIENYNENPGRDGQIIDVIGQLQDKDVDVYVAFSCLLGKSGGMYDPMEDKTGGQSGNWISPTDRRRWDDLVTRITRCCARVDPAGVLLWYASFPNEKYGYECDGCVSDVTGELDLDNRADILTEFLTTVATRVRDRHPDVEIAIETDIQGASDIKYRYGVDIDALGDALDEIIIHVHDSSDATVTKTLQMVTKAKKAGIETSYYFSVIDPAAFEAVFNRFAETYPQDVLIYSPKEKTVTDVVRFFLRQKWVPVIRSITLAGSGAALTAGLLEFYTGFGPSNLPGIVPSPSILLSCLLLLVGIYTERSLLVLDRVETTLKHRFVSPFH